MRFDVTFVRNAENLSWAVVHDVTNDGFRSTFEALVVRSKPRASPVARRPTTR